MPIRLWGFLNMKEQIRKNKKLILISVLILAVSFLFTFISGEEGALSDGMVARSEEGDREVVMDVSLDGEEPITLKINVFNKDLSDEELKILMDDSRGPLIKKFLGENESIDNVTTNLNFFEDLSGFPFTYSFSVKGFGKIDEAGNILTMDDFEEIVEVTAEYKDYAEEFVIPIKAHPGPEVKRAILSRVIEEEIKNIEKESRAAGSFKLPDNVIGNRLIYREVKSSPDYRYVLFAMGVVVMLFAAKIHDERKAVEDKKAIMLKEYPIIIRNMSMFITAGMSIRNTWKRIVEDSKKNRSDNPIYSEMELTVKEMEGGIAETIAYERFSERLMIPEITRFIALLNQNIKRGSTVLTDLLSDEANKAYESMKQKMKKQGEEAGTKLLVPMMLLMVMVMAIIMVPAFFTL